MLAVTPNSRSNNPPDSVATIPNRWLLGLRALWVFVALNSIFAIAWTIYFTRQFSDNLPARITDGLTSLGLTNDFYFWFHAAFLAFDFVIYFVVGALIFLLRPRERIAWLASIYLIASGVSSSFPVAVEYGASLATAPLLFRASGFVNSLFSSALAGVFIGLFPDGRFVPKWIRYIVLYGFVFAAAWGAFPDIFATSEGWFLAFIYVSILLGNGLMLYAQVWRYRYYSTPIQKQQTKWLIFSFAAMFLLIIGSALSYVASSETGEVTSATSVVFDLLIVALLTATVFVPLAVGFAILRYRLWDIDIIIRKTLTYALVAALLALVYFGSVVLLQQLFALISGQRSEVITVISTLAIAALFVPLRNKIQELVDRRFYRNKYDAQQVLADFANTVRDETDLEQLTGRLVYVVNETMQPKSVSVWLKKES